MKSEKNDILKNLGECLSNSTNSTLRHVELTYTELCRFILIKYADRGLVKNGKIPKLFDCLYLLIAIVLTLLFIMFILSRHFSASDKKSFFMKLCLKEDHKIDQTTWRIIIQMFSFRILILTSILIFYFASWYYIKSKSKNGKVPSKFGRYQRNIYTFSDTVLIVTTIFFAVSISCIFEMYVHFAEGYNKSQLQTLILLMNFFFDLITSFVLPLLLIIKLLRKIPDLFYKKTKCTPSINVFYVRQPDFVPREDVIRIPKSPTFKNAIINVKEAG